jgi:hypothetical protein
LALEDCRQVNDQPEWRQVTKKRTHRTRSMTSVII